MRIVAKILGFLGLRLWNAFRGYVNLMPEIFSEFPYGVCTCDSINDTCRSVLAVILAVTSPIWIPPAIWIDEIRIELRKRRVRFFTPENDQRPILGVQISEWESAIGEWELVAATRSTSNGYFSFEFYPAYISDQTSCLDDRFAPDNVSLIYNIEIRRRSMFEQEVVIWRVSMFSGVQKSIHSFDVFWEPDFPGDDQYRPGRVKCFENNGVVVITCPKMESANFLVYDSRTGKSAVFDYFRETNSSHLVFEVSGIERLVGGGDDEYDGWSMQILEASRVRVNPGFRAVVTKSIVLFQPRQQPPAMVVQEKRIDFINNVDQPVRFYQLHTSGGMFGVFVPGEQRSMLYDAIERQFIYFASVRELRESEPSLFYNRFGGFPHRFAHCPVVCSPRECIHGLHDGTFHRRSYDVESLPYVLLKRLFRERPELRHVCAIKFLEMTGVDGMDAHFE